MRHLKSILAGAATAMIAATLWLCVGILLPIWIAGYRYRGRRTERTIVAAAVQPVAVSGSSLLLAGLVGFSAGYLGYRGRA